MTLPVVVVGGGTAGSTAALTLSSHTTRDIVVFEPGDVSDCDDDSRFFGALAQSHLLSHHLVHSEHRNLTYTQARAVGGGSALNGMLLSGAVPDFLEGLTSIPSESDMGDLSRALMRSGGRACRMWWNGGRWNPGRALLHLRDEGRVDVRQQRAETLLHRNGAVTGVMVDGVEVATDCVVLAAGAIASPEFLLRSSCGELVPNIGIGLQDHPSITFDIVRTTSACGVFDASVVMDLVTNDGGVGLVVAYERTDASNPDAGMLSVMLMNPESRGSITMNPDVRVEMGYLSNRVDAKRFRSFVQHAARILLSEPFMGISGNITVGAGRLSCDDVLATDDASLDAWILESLVPVSHVSSSLSHSVDHRGRLTGLGGVVVADASVLSHVPHETPAAAVTMESQRIARLLGEELS